MAHCCVPGCTTKRWPNSSLVFHLVPREATKRFDWANAIGIPLHELKEWSTVCSLHFSASDYERDLRAELTGMLKVVKMTLLI